MLLLLDTNVISEVRKSSCHPNVLAWMSAQATDALYISAITVLEIQRGISQAAQRGDALQAQVFTRWLEGQVLPAFAGRILPVDHVVARRAAQLPWADAKDYRDPLIAATGLVHGATVVTRNTKHFEASGARLVNPWDDQA
ncbi:type II toxin-antitoxin system VapC family toxin [Variovorax sp. ZS18.2.2]|uniref:type II toxin-antitoxin system VapC family toxin n=1 Tax=Variovorax sp. ZS18.2.2 TaxID=2971255 RepID=UPI0021515A44|nr:type II toxin-antitoxin system VapC family toxin [Variovorax sp. ZS18.2.2]MCR6481060.1 type II toxin-antitoxin system VapC family toxin [Variovorax sp. ZS18.2.2]